MNRRHERKLLPGRFSPINCKLRLVLNAVACHPHSDSLPRGHTSTLVITRSGRFCDLTKVTLQLPAGPFKSLFVFCCVKLQPPTPQKEKNKTNANEMHFTYARGETGSNQKSSEYCVRFWLCALAVQLHQTHSPFWEDNMISYLEHAHLWHLHLMTTAQSKGSIRTSVSCCSLSFT